MTLGNISNTFSIHKHLDMIFLLQSYLKTQQKKFQFYDFHCNHFIYYIAEPRQRYIVGMKYTEIIVGLFNIKLLFWRRGDLRIVWIVKNQFASLFPFTCFEKLLKNLNWRVFGILFWAIFISARIHSIDISRQGFIIFFLVF